MSMAKLINEALSTKEKVAAGAAGGAALGLAAKKVASDINAKHENMNPATRQMLDELKAGGVHPGSKFVAGKQVLGDYAQQAKNFVKDNEMPLAGAALGAGAIGAGLAAKKYLSRKK